LGLKYTFETELPATFIYNALVHTVT